jgi:hypothetical protein
MTDQELDRALADALDVEPRPGFLARVRTEVARQPAPAAWPQWWHAVAAAAMLVVATVTAYRVGVEDRAPVVEPARTPAPLVATRTAPVPPAVAPVTSAVTPARVVPPAFRRMPSALPAPQISPDDANVLRLLAGVSAGLFSTTAERDAHEPLAVSGIELTTIEVMPLAQMAAANSGERQ